MIHAVAAVFTSATLLIVSAMWMLAERRQAAAEQQRAESESRRLAAEKRVDEIRAQTIALLINESRLIGMIDEHLSAWADETPQAWTLDPAQDRIRLAHSAAFSALRLTRGAIAAFQEGDQHGREA